MIKLVSVSKSFQNKENILDNITLDIKNNQITAIVGLNGSGKSTLISLISGYKKTSSGFITKNSISIMPDAENLYSDMSGEKFLKFMSGIKSSHLSNKNQYLEISQLLFSNCDLKKKIKDYSFGMKKKISFIQAYIGNFDTYIFDEPTSGVDVKSAKIMMQLLTKLKNEGKAVLFTSHNLDEIQEYCDYIYILKEGHISEKGNLQQIINKSSKTSYTLQVNDIYLKKVLKILKGVDYKIINNNIIVNQIDIEGINEILRRIIQSEVLLEGVWNNASLKDSVLK